MRTYICTVRTYGTFHNKLDDKRAVNQRTYTVHSPDVRRTDDRPIIITSLLRIDSGSGELVF